MTPLLLLLLSKVILVDEGVFPFTFDTIRAYLREVDRFGSIVYQSRGEKGRFASGTSLFFEETVCIHCLSDVSGIP